MNTTDPPAPADRPRFPIGSLIIAAIAVIPTIMILIQRSLVFRNCSRYGLIDDGILPLAIWLALALIMVCIAKPWKPRPRLARGLLVTGGLTALFGLALLIVFSTAGGAYQFMRFETMTRNLGISTPFDTPVRQRHQRLLVDSTYGPYFAADKPVLERIVDISVPPMTEDPRAARVVYAALRHHGHTFESILDLPGGLDLAFGALLGETDPQPWFELDWLERPLLQPEVSRGLQAGLLTAHQAQRVVTERLAHLDDATLVETEQWLYAMMSFPTLFDEETRGLILKRWPEQFDDLQPLAIEGLIVRGEICTVLEDVAQVDLKLTLSGTYPSDYTYRELPNTLPRMFAGVVQSCGVTVTLVDGDDADMHLHVELDAIPHHEYTRPTYTTETYYEYRNTYRYGRRYMVGTTKRVQRTRTVQSGSETLTAYAPVARAAVDYGSTHLEWPEGLLLWHHIRFDPKTKTFTTPEDEAVWSRLWPLGLHERHFKYAFMDNPY